METLSRPEIDTKNTEQKIEALEPPYAITLERYKELADRFIQDGKITEASFYEDQENLDHIDLEGLPKSVREDVATLKQLLFGAVLKDTISEKFDEEGNIIKGARDEIKEYARQRGLEAQNFYNRNRLEASNIGKALQVISFLAEEFTFSLELEREFESVRQEFAVPGSVNFQIGLYYKMSKEEKYAFIEKLTRLIEHVLQETFRHYGKI